MPCGPSGRGSSFWGPEISPIPLYFLDLKSKLNPLGNGLFALKEEPEGTHFLLTAEVSNMYSQGGKSRRIHTLIFAPSFEVVERINTRLAKYGKTGSDGRPIFGFSAKDLLKMILDISPECLIIPAHVWTPWFSILGARSRGLTRSKNVTKRKRSTSGRLKPGFPRTRR